MGNLHINKMNIQCMYMHIRVESIYELLVEHEKIVSIMQLGQHGFLVYPSQNNSVYLFYLNIITIYIHVS